MYSTISDLSINVTANYNIRSKYWCVQDSTRIKYQCVLYTSTVGQGIKIKGKGNGAGLAWESQSHCFADELVITNAHSFGTDTQHDNSQGNWRTMSSIIIKLE